MPTPYARAELRYLTTILQHRSVLLVPWIDPMSWAVTSQVPQQLTMNRGDVATDVASQSRYTADTSCNKTRVTNKHSRLSKAYM
jgi:hypothetical protein